MFQQVFQVSTSLNFEHLTFLGFLFCPNAFSLESLEDHANLHTITLKIHQQAMHRSAPIDLSMLEAFEESILHCQGHLFGFRAPTKVRPEFGRSRIGWCFAASNAMAFQQCSRLLFKAHGFKIGPGPTGSLSFQRASMRRI